MMGYPWEIDQNLHHQQFKENDENDMTFCYLSFLGRYCFRPTSRAGLQLLTLARCLIIWFLFVNVLLIDSVLQDTTQWVVPSRNPKISNGPNIRFPQPGLCDTRCSPTPYRLTLFDRTPLNDDLWIIFFIMMASGAPLARFFCDTPHSAYTKAIVIHSVNKAHFLFVNKQTFFLFVVSGLWSVLGWLFIFYLKV